MQHHVYTFRKFELFFRARIARYNVAYLDMKGRLAMYVSDSITVLNLLHNLSNAFAGECTPGVCKYGCKREKCIPFPYKHWKGNQKKNGKLPKNENWIHPLSCIFSWIIFLVFMKYLSFSFRIYITTTAYTKHVIIIIFSDGFLHWNCLCIIHL